MRPIFVFALLLIVHSQQEVCMTEHKDSCMVMDGLKELGISWIDYISETPVVKREMPIAAKFRNFRNQVVYEFYDDGTPEGTFLGQVDPKGYGGSNTYTTHVFYFKTKKGKEVARFTMTAGRLLYVIPPKSKKMKNSPEYQHLLKEMKFQEEYYQRMGQPWLSVYPRSPITLFQWKATYIGEIFEIYSDFGYCSNSECSGDNDELDLKLICVSLKPLVYIIEGVVGDWESDHVLEQALPRMGTSQIGQGKNALKSTTRTSKTAWLQRDTTPVLNQIFNRIGDILNMDEEILQHNKNAEYLQVVQYKLGENYGPHHDFSDDGTIYSRFLTLGIYLRTPTEGGYTSFPKAFGGKGLKVRPPQGGGVLFYSLLEDGNGDDYSLHTGTTVVAGEKYFCNLWVWDPKKR